MNKLRRLAFTLFLLVACTPGGESTTTTGTGTVPTTAATTATSADPTGTTAPTSNLPDLNGRTVILAVDNQSFPFNFLRENEASGWDYGLVGAICEGLNCQVEVSEVDPEDVVTAVIEGRADLASDGSIFTEDLTSQVDASQPLIPVEQRLVVREEETRYDTVGQFTEGNGAVGVVEGTSNQEVAIATWGNDRTRSYPELEAAIAALLEGDVDAVVIYDFAGQGYVGEGDDEVKLIQGVLGSGEVGLIFTPGSDLVAPFDEALTELVRNGTMGTLNALWFAPATAS